MSRQAPVYSVGCIGLVSAALLTLCVLLVGTDARAAHPDLRTSDPGVATTLAAAPACLDCIVLKQHKINSHRCTHGAHARFAFNLLRPSPRVLDGTMRTATARDYASVVFDLSDDPDAANSPAAPFDETFKSIYEKTRRMQP